MAPERPELEQELPPEIELEIELEKPEVKAEEPKKAEEDALAVLQRSYEQEISRREASESREREAENRAKKAENEAFQRYKETIERSAEVSKANLERTKKDLALAFENADYSKVADLQAQLADNQIELRELARAKTEQRPAPQKVADPVDQWIDSSSPRTADYLRKHRAEVGDKKTQTKLTAAHWNAIAEGHTVDSDAYFDFIDGQVWKTAEAPKQRPSATPAAPVSRGGTPTTPPSATRVKLTAGQVSAAKALGLTNNEYARRVVEMSKPDYDGPRFNADYTT